MANKVYSNHPLLQHKQQIRLIHLKPGSSGDPIRCTVRVASLQNSPRYEALSYHWGEGRHQEIILDGIGFKISPNLWKALRELRRPSDDRILWVDALCINQKDDLEKSWQVNMMDKIYENCRRGLLFLGQKREQSDSWCSCKPNDGGECKEAVAVARRTWHRRSPDMSELRVFLKQLAAKAMATKSDHLNNIPSIVNLLDESDNKNDKFMEPIQAVGALMRRSWWSRMWTVQEAVLPPNTLIICGEVRLDWEIVVDAARSWEAHTTSGCCNALHEKLSRNLQYPTRGMRTSDIMVEFCKGVKSIENVRERRNKGRGLRFLDVYRHFRHREAGVKLDKVYALLGLVKNRPCRPVYGKSIWALNRELSLHLLMNSPNQRNPFEALYGRSVSPEEVSSPSWQVYFGRQWGKHFQKQEDRRNELRPDFKASGSKVAEIRILDPPKSRVLSVTSARVDQVEDVSDVFSDFKHDAIRAFCVKCSGIVRWQERKAHKYPSDKRGRETFLSSSLNPNSRKTVDRAFERALLSNRCQNQWAANNLRRPDVEDFKSLERWMFSSDTLNNGLMSQVECTIYNRKFFTTKGGLLGFGPSRMRSGDEVWLIYGDQVPFILRPLGKEDGQQVHGVVGDCYVQGIMEGEAVNSALHTNVILR